MSHLQITINNRIYKISNGDFVTLNNHYRESYTTLSELHDMEYYIVEDMLPATKKYPEGLIKLENLGWLKTEYINPSELRKIKKDKFKGLNEILNKNGFNSIHDCFYKEK